LIRRTRSHHCKGFSLAEVLVALLMIGVAIIGIAALYADGTGAARTSEPRLRAAELAEQIAARITSNPAGRIGYASVVGVVCDQEAKPKRAQDAAAVEAACWHQQVGEQLPSGTGSITRDATTTPPTYVIAVSWSSPEGGAASYVIRVQAADEG
jgi:type IV pilus assembly protein PilV